MTKTQFLELLTAHMETSGHSQQDVAKLARISQSRVSRILQGEFDRFSSKSVRQLAKYASINTEKRLDPQNSDILMSAVAAIWDGSKKHEVALAKLLRALKGLT